MFVNGRLTAPPRVEVDVVTNSVFDVEPATATRHTRAKAHDLDTSVFSAGSQTRMLRFAGRARQADLSAGRPTNFLPANAPHALSAAREGAPGS